VGVLGVPEGSAPLADRVRHLRRRRRAMAQRVTVALAIAAWLVVVLMLAIGTFGH